MVRLYSKIMMFQNRIGPDFKLIAIAGDHVKFGFPMAGFTTLLAWGVIDYQDAYASTGNLEAARDVIRYAASYFINVSKYIIFF